MTIYDRQRLDRLHAQLKDIETINVVMQIETTLIDSFERVLSSMWVIKNKCDKILERLSDDSK